MIIRKDNTTENETPIMLEIYKLLNLKFDDITTRFIIQELKEQELYHLERYTNVNIAGDDFWQSPYNKDYLADINRIDNDIIKKAVRTHKLKSLNEK